MRWGAVLLGLGAGATSSTLLALALWAGLEAVGADQAPLLALTIAVLAGFGVAGYAAGRTSAIAHRFNGSVAGLGLAALVLVIARLGGSPAPTPEVLLLAGFAILLGGLGGMVGGRRRGRS